MGNREHVHSQLASMTSAMAGGGRRRTGVGSFDAWQSRSNPCAIVLNAAPAIHGAAKDAPNEEAHHVACPSARNGGKGLDNSVDER